MKTSSISPNFYYSQNQKRQSSPAFTGLTDNRVFNKIESVVIDGCVKLVSTDAAKKLVTGTNKYNKFTKNLTSHLIVLGSTILSGFYVLKTLKNKNMDEDKRKTLAINQGLVYVASTIMAYTLDNKARKYFNEHIINKFVAINKQAQREKIAKLVLENPSWDNSTKILTAVKSHREFLKNLNKWKSGFGIARTIIIIDTVYRFIAPVIVTPFANFIGNKLRENKSKEAK